MKTMRERHAHGDELFPFQLYDQEAVKGKRVCYLHWHKEVEWFYVYKGSVTLFVDGKEQVVSQGEICVIEPNSVHYMIAREDCHYYTCVFKKELLQFSYNDISSMYYINPYIENEYVVETPINIIDSEAMEHFLNIVHSYNKQSLGYQLDIKLHLLYIFLYFIEHQHLKKNTASKHDLEIIGTILSYIETHYDEKITSQQLASIAGYNHQYFSRFFKESTGYTPIEYVNYYRVEKATKQLINEDTSILDISVACGFDSCSYFIKKFKEIKGVSPSAYRKKLIQNYNERFAD